MGRMYIAEFENVSVAVVMDFFELAPAANKPIRIHAVFLSQVTDVGDANEEMLRLKIIRGHTTSGSVGSTQTPTPLDKNDAASGVTLAELNNTTIASAGTPVDMHSETFNIRSGWVYLPTPEMRPRCQNSDLIVVRLMAAPGSAIFMSGTIYFEEI